MVFQYYLPQTGNPPTVPYAAVVPVALVTNRWYIIIWVRYSPYTVVITKYHSQEIRIHYCWHFLHKLLSEGGILPEDFECEVHDVVFGSDEIITRWSEGSGEERFGAPSTRESKSYKKLITLCKDKASKDSDLNLLIVALRPDRFAVEPEELEKIQSEFMEANKRVHVMFAEQCGVHPMGWAERNYEYLRETKQISKSSDRMNPAKSLERENWGIVAEERIDAKAVELKKVLRTGKGKSASQLKAAVILGELIQQQNAVRVSEVKKAIGAAQQKGKSIEDGGSEVMKKLKVKTSVVLTVEAKEFDIIFLRWSPGGFPAILTEEGAHCHQAACCTLLREDKAVLESLGVAKVGRLIVIMDPYKLRTSVNDGLSLATRLVLDNRVNAVFTTRFNRINNRLFKELCDRMKVPIIAKDCLGLSIDDYMAEEESRNEKNREAKKKLNLENEEEAKATFAGNPIAELVYNEMKINSRRRTKAFLVEGLQNLTFGESGAFEARRLNDEEYRRNMNSSNTGADGQLNEDEDDSDYDYSDSDEEESD